MAPPFHTFSVSQIDTAFASQNELNDSISVQGWTQLETFYGSI